MKIFINTIIVEIKEDNAGDVVIIHNKYFIKDLCKIFLIERIFKQEYSPILFVLFIY